MWDRQRQSNASEDSTDIWASKKERKKERGEKIREDKMQTLKLSMVKTHFKLRKPHHNVHANAC